MQNTSVMVLCSVALCTHLTQLFSKLMTVCALKVTEESDGGRKLNSDNGKYHYQLYKFRFQ